MLVKQDSKLGGKWIIPTFYFESLQEAIDLKSALWTPAGLSYLAKHSTQQDLKYGTTDLTFLDEIIEDAAKATEFKPIELPPGLSARYIDFLEQMSATGSLNLDGMPEERKLPFNDTVAGVTKLVLSQTAVIV